MVDFINRHANCRIIEGLDGGGGGSGIHYSLKV